MTEAQAERLITALERIAGALEKQRQLAEVPAQQKPRSRYKIVREVMQDGQYKTTNEVGELLGVNSVKMTHLAKHMGIFHNYAGRVTRWSEEDIQRARQILGSEKQPTYSEKVARYRQWTDADYQAGAEALAVRIAGEIIK